MVAKVRWTSEMEALLGTMPDLDVALELGLNKSTVGGYRRALGISAYKVAVVNWTSEMDALLGTEPDIVIATKLGLGRCTVRDRRYLLDVPSWRSQHRIIPVGVHPQSSRARQIYDARRRHLEKELPDTLTNEDWEFAILFFEGRCAYCGRRRFLGEDHLVPVTKEGGRTPLNIIPTCWECNNTKQATRADVWIRRHFGTEESGEIIERIVTYLTEVQRRTTNDV